MARVVLAFLFLFSWAVCAVPAQVTTVRYTVVLPDGKRVPLNAQRLHDRDYVPFSELATTFFRGGVVENNGSGILWKNEFIRSVSSSFYISRGNVSGVRIAQMPYPTLSIDQKTCVPFLPLCSAVETLGLFAVEIQGNTVVLHNLSKHSPSAVLLPSYAASEKSSRSAGKISDEEEDGAEEKYSSPKGIMTGGTLPEEEVDVAEEPASVMVPENIGKALSPFKRSAASVGSATPTRQNAAPVAVPQQVKSDTAQRAQRPAKKKDEVQPNRYILPRGLYRRELMDEEETRSDSLHSFFLDTSSKLQAGPPLAYVASASVPLLTIAEPTASVPLDGTISIVAMDATVGRGTVQIEVQGNAAINQYQRPEKNGRQVVLRFPSARNALSADVLKRLGTIAPLSSVRSEQRGNILVYTLAFTGDITECTYTRKSASVLLFTITTPTGSSSVGTVARNEAKRWALDVIVLDAGHGGKDVGAISISGKHEKDITLALVKKLGALIQEQMPSTKVVYTRTDDRFVELYRRGQIANEAGGKLFISIHCNSMPTKPHPAHGCETYILRSGRNEDAVRVAERENSAIKFESNQKRYKKLTDEQFIVVNMAQSAFVKLSEKFGSMVQQEVSAETPLADRGVNQAGFYVLVGASMPNILFESAFLSNADDEQFITSAKGQDDIVRGLFNAISLYAEQYEQMIKTQK